jgi:hypothetical protein
MKQEEKERVGKLAGFGADALTGAQIGTAVIPIPVIGTIGAEGNPSNNMRARIPSRR